MLVSAVQPCKSVIRTIYISPPSCTSLPPAPGLSSLAAEGKNSTYPSQLEDQRAGLHPRLCSDSLYPQELLGPCPHPSGSHHFHGNWLHFELLPHVSLPEGSLWSPDPALPLLLGGWKDWEINTSEKHQPMMTESWGTIHTSWCLCGVTLRCIFCAGPRRARVAKPQLPRVVTHFLTHPLYWFPSLLCLTSPSPHSCVLGSPPNKSFSLESFLPEEPK